MTWGADTEDQWLAAARSLITQLTYQPRWLRRLLRVMNDPHSDGPASRAAIHHGLVNVGVVPAPGRRRVCATAITSAGVQ